MNHRFLQLEETLTCLQNGSHLESHALYPGIELFFLTPVSYTHLTLPTT